jgi:pimeloyl-ACP methyl ester carboxylesterase
MGVEPLPRRPFLGLHMKAGVVAEVLEGSAAQEAHLRAGDRLIAIDSEDVIDAIHLLGIARGRRVGERIAFRVEREGRVLELAGRAPPLPIEPGAEVGELLVHGHRLRTISNGDLERDAVLYVQGIRPRSVEHPLDPNDPLCHLVDGWARAGLHVLRIERAGVGDSEGPSCATTGLDLELDTYIAAIDSLGGRAERVFLFGQSLGAMTAPLLALERPVAGVIVYGASAERWVECVASTTRRQLRMRSKPEAEVEADAARWAEMLRLVCREGWTPDLVFERRPELRTLRSVDCMGETYQGRHVSLFQQLDGIDLFSVWREVGRLRVPVLVARGEYDWICSRDEAEAIVRAAGDSARYLELPHTGHDWLAYASFEKSQQWGEGRWEGAVVGAVQTFTSPQASGKTHP